MKKLVVILGLCLLCAVYAIGFSACDGLTNSNNSNSGTTSNNTNTSNIAVEAYVDGVLYNTVYTSANAKYKITPPAVAEDITINPNSNKYFYGWFLDSNFQTPLNSDCAFTQNSKIYGKWITVYINSFRYTVANGYAKITEFTNSTATVVVVPAYINSFPVSTIDHTSKDIYDSDSKSYIYMDWYGVFEDKTQIRTVIICDGIERINGLAFSNCNSMQEITIPNSVTFIGNFVFQKCNILTRITFNGTKAQWNAISKGDMWKSGLSGGCKVYCSDGEIKI